MNDKELAPLIIGKLLNIGGMLQRKANQMLLPFNLNQQQFSILFEIDKAGKVTQKSMVNRLLLEKAHVSKVVKKLNAMELIDITVSSEDKRSSWLSMTQKGSDTVKDCQKLFSEWNGEWMSQIESDQLKSTLDNIAALQDVLKDNMQQ
jgi:DNA-binding MarR family transcriptional regulator